MRDYGQKHFVDPDIFTKTLIFAGKFRSNSIEEGPFSIELSYSVTNDRAPSGIIRGTSSDYDRLERFFRRSSPPQQLESISEAAGREQIFVEKLIMRSISRGRYPDDEKDAIHQVIGFFDVFSVTIIKEFPDRPMAERSMVFSLSGPCKEWGTWPLRNLSYLGNIETEHMHTERPLLRINDVKVAVQNNYIYEDISASKNIHKMQNNDKKLKPHRKFMVEAELHAISISECEPTRNKDDFISRSKEIVDVMCILTSFMAKASTDWFSYVYFDGSSIIECIREVKSDPDPEIQYEDHVIDLEDISEFLGMSVDSFLRNQRNGVDLKLPILNYVAGHRARFITDKLEKFYNAIEQIIALMPKETKGSALLSEGKVKDLVASTKKFLSESSIDARTAEIIINKTWRVADSGLRGQLVSVASSLGISFDDIDGEEKMKAAFAVRNKIVHSHKEPPIREIIDSANFLETVFERIIIALIAWNGRKNTPTHKNRYLLKNR